MIEIKDLLKSFNNILLKEEIKKQALISVLKEVLNLDIQPKDVLIKNQTVFLNTKPIYKSELLLRKEEIISKLEKNFLSIKLKNFY